ncbi:MAG: hypothetical protein IKX35_09900 [Bacteroidales bacterium]|nr:hypothetical protein [Bacteroidales bacterium]
MNGTKQFNDVKTMYEQIEMMIRNATNCKKLEEAVATLTLGSMAIGLGSNKYAQDQRMTENEELIVKDLGKHLMEKAEAKADELGCEKKHYSL